SFIPADVMKLAAFRSKYGVPASVPIYGPYLGKLDNSGASVELFKPDPTEPAPVSYVLVDKVAYKDSDLWPGSADGIGASLQRKVLAAYGNDPANWIAARPSAAAPAGSGAAPAFINPPVDQSVVAGSTATFNVTVSGSAPLAYQWRFNGTNLVGATNATLVVPNAQPRNSGPYSVSVFNDAGSV